MLRDMCRDADEPRETRFERLPVYACADAFKPPILIVRVLNPETHRKHNRNMMKKYK